MHGSVFEPFVFEELGRKGKQKHPQFLQLKLMEMTTSCPLYGRTTLRSGQFVLFMYLLLFYCNRKFTKVYKKQKKFAKVRTCEQEGGIDGNHLRVSVSW